MIVLGRMLNMKSFGKFFSAFMMLFGMPMFVYFGVTLIHMGYILDGSMLLGCAVTSLYCSHLMYQAVVKEFM